MADLRGVDNYGFQWSTSEQVWPFEKASDGSTLYCKEFQNQGALPNTGNMYIAHGLGDTSSFVLVRGSCEARGVGGGYQQLVPNAYSTISFTPSGLEIHTTTNMSGYSAYRTKIIYAKSS